MLTVKEIPECPDYSRLPAERIIVLPSYFDSSEEDQYPSAGIYYEGYRFYRRHYNQFEEKWEYTVYATQRSQDGPILRVQSELIKELLAKKEIFYRPVKIMRT